MSKRILIIEDDADLSSQMAEVLSDEGHAVDVYLFKREELPAFKPDNYDILIMDFKMPGISALDILKAAPMSNTKAKILIISGRPFIEDLLNDENLSHMVTEVIPKPFSILDLLDKINAL